MIVSSNRACSTDWMSDLFVYLIDDFPHRVELQVRVHFTDLIDRITRAEGAAHFFEYFANFVIPDGFLAEQIEFVEKDKGLIVDKILKRVVVD